MFSLFMIFFVYTQLCSCIIVSSPHLNLTPLAVFYVLPSEARFRANPVGVDHKGEKRIISRYRSHKPCTESKYRHDRWND